MRSASYPALVVDGKRGWLGTSNWERNYFYESRNVGVLIDDPAIAGQLAGFFATLWQSVSGAALFRAPDPSASDGPLQIRYRPVARP